VRWSFAFSFVAVYFTELQMQYRMMLQQRQL